LADQKDGPLNPSRVMNTMPPDRPQSVDTINGIVSEGMSIVANGPRHETSQKKTPFTCNVTGTMIQASRAAWGVISEQQGLAN